MIWLDTITENLSGPLRLRVRGRSMLPTLRPGDEVVVHPVTADALEPGDWVVVRSAQGAFLHRYLGRRDGGVVTKGDGHRALDPLWSSDAVLGRVVEAQRDGRCFYRRTPGRLRREKVLAAGHQVLGSVWGVLRRVKALLWALCAVALTATFVWAAVTLTSFTAEAGADFVVLKWETASETDNLGWRLWRSLSENDRGVDISGFIGSLDEGAGASYIFTDTDVIPGTTYYYQLQDLPADGTQNSFTDPISATIPLSTAPSLTPTPTATPTVTPTPSPTSTPNPNVRFWADKTELTAGECTNLYWQTNNILAVFFDNVGVAGDGKRQFCPCATESHTLRVKYLNSTIEDFVITLNVTGQCGGATVAPTSTRIPREPITNGATATPRPTFTPGPTLPPVNPTATAFVEGPVATATSSVAMPLVTQTVAQGEAQPAAPFVSPLTTPLPASSESQGGAAATINPPLTRPSVEGAPAGAPVDELLSVWLLIVGGILGAGFIGAGILMWKRQQ